MKKKNFFLKFSIPFALSYWVFDSSVHFFVYGEFEFEVIPSEFNELWMRGIIFVLLIAFGIFADYHTNKIAQKDSEKYDVYIAMLSATHHILNNFINNMILFRGEAENSKDFDRDILTLYDQVIDDTSEQIKNLENINEPDKEIIERKYKPQ